MSTEISLADVYASVRDATATVVLSEGGLCSGWFPRIGDADGANTLPPGIFVTAAHCTVLLPAIELETAQGADGHVHRISLDPQSPEVARLVRGETESLVVRSTTAGNHSHSVTLRRSRSNPERIEVAGVGPALGHTHAARQAAPQTFGMNVAVKNLNGVAGDHRVIRAQVVGYSAQTDSAVLLVPGVTADHPTVPFAPREGPGAARTGDRCFVVGNPEGRDDSSISAGYVRDAHYELEAFRTTDVYVNAPTTFGNSGSPVFNVRGEVISILTWGPNERSGDAAVTEGGGARADHLIPVVEALAASLSSAENPRVDADGRYLVPYAGLTGQTSDARNALRLRLPRMEGYYITSVAPDSPFASVFGQGSAQNRFGGPVHLISIDGRVMGPHEGQSTLSDTLFFADVGDTLPITWRLALTDPPGEQRRSTVTLSSYIPVDLDAYQMLRASAGPSIR